MVCDVVDAVSDFEKEAREAIDEAYRKSPSKAAQAELPWHWKIRSLNNLRLIAELEGKSTREIVDAVIAYANRHIVELWNDSRGLNVTPESEGAKPANQQSDKETPNYEIGLFYQQACYRQRDRIAELEDKLAIEQSRSKLRGDSLLSLTEERDALKARIAELESEIKRLKGEG